MDCHSKIISLYSKQFLNNLNSLKKKILFFGPIGDFGGRDIEVNIIAHAIAEQYDTKVLSTMFITEDSCAVNGICIVDFNSFDIEVYNSNWMLRILSHVFYWKNKRKKLPYAYVKNGLSKRLYDFDKPRRKILEEEIKNADAVIACVQPTSLYLKNAIEICQKLNKPFFIRTTGEVQQLNPSFFDFLKKVTCFIHHSEINAQNLNKQMPLPYAVVDQCAQLGPKLLKVPLKEYNKVYGFIGRLAPEKGILELVEFFKNVKDAKLVIAGNGIIKEDVLKAIKGQDNIEYIGLVSPDELDSFFERISVFILPSLEESGPLVGLEAMAAAKLILTTDTGAMKERLVDSANDFWFDIKNEQSFIEKIDKIKSLSNEEFLAITKGNRERYLEEYQFTSIKKKYLDCINKYVN